MTMAVHVAPERRYAVEVAFPGNVDQIRALAAGDDHRLLRHPVPHLRERMPDIGMVPAGQFDSVVLGHTVSASTRAKVSAASVRSSELCVLMAVTRSRAVPAGTVGGRIPWTNTPWVSRRCEIRIVRSESPTSTGRMCPACAGSRKPRRWKAA